MRSITLQPTTDATGGSPAVVLFALVGLLLTACLSLVVAYLVVEGYRRNRNRDRLFLAIGLLLLTTVPIVLQLLLTNLTGISQLGRSAVANTSKLLGLGAMLYAIYGRTQSRTRESNRVEQLVMGPLLQGSIGAEAGLIALFSVVVAVVGVFVAYQAYRGFRRNESRPMLFLALGIVLLTAVPTGVHHGLGLLTTATEATILLAIMLAHLSGVLSILYALTRA